MWSDLHQQLTGAIASSVAAPSPAHAAADPWSDLDIPDYLRRTPKAVAS